MKVTKRQLKQIIKEELEGTLSEQTPAPDMAEVEDLAATFENSPVIMDAVEQAMQDPEVQAALEQASSMQEGDDPYADAYAKRADRAAAGVYAGGGIVGLGGALTITPAALFAFAPALAVSPAIVALGITAGPALFAIGHLVATKFGEIESTNRTKAEVPSRRKSSDFNYWDHEKMRAQSKQS